MVTERAPTFATGGGGRDGDGYYGGGYQGGFGPAIGLGIGGLATGALVGSYDPYHGDCSGYPVRYDQYGRVVNPC